MKQKRLELLESMIANGSSDPFVWYARAMELRSLGRRDDALLAFQEVLSRFPDYVPTYLMAGQVAEELGKDEEARRWLKSGIEAAKSAGDHHALGELVAALDQLS